MARMGFVFPQVLLIAAVIAADALAGYVAVLAGTIYGSICVDSFSASASGCYDTGRSIDWGPTQLVFFALIALSLIFLGAYLVRGSRRWLVATLVLAAGFVAVPTAMAAAAVFNDSGRIRLSLFGG
jgi:hypothetical protein